MSFKDEFFSKCLVLDTETTNKDYNIAEIIEVGFVIRENDDWIIFQDLHKPSKSIPAEIEALCYITNKMVEDKPSFIESKEVFQSVVDSYKTGYLIAHNYAYDMHVLKNNGVNLEDYTWLCTWRMAKKLFNNLDMIESTALPYLRFALDLDVPIEMHCHRAGIDSFCTGKLLEILVDLMESQGIIDIDAPYGPQIVEWLKAPIISNKMTFGKYKNELMVNVPKEYWAWALNNMESLDDTKDNFDPDFAASVHHALQNS